MLNKKMYPSPKYNFKDSVFEVYFQQDLEDLINLENKDKLTSFFNNMFYYFSEQNIDLIPLHNIFLKTKDVNSDNTINFSLRLKYLQGKNEDILPLLLDYLATRITGYSLVLTSSIELSKQNIIELNFKLLINIIK